MRKSKLYWGFLVGVVASLGLGGWLTQGELALDASSRPQLIEEFTVIVQDQKFTPKEINIKALTPLRLTVWSLDYEYSVSGPGIAEKPKRVPAGGRTLISFTPPALGGYELRGEAIGINDVARQEMRLAINAGPCSLQMKALVNPVPANAESIEAGRQLFRQHCASCHGETGMGDGSKANRLATKPTDLGRPALATMADGEIFWVIRDGEGEMPSFRTTLPDQDKWRLVNYVRALIRKPGE